MTTYIGGAELTSKNSHESITVSMIINTQHARSIDKGLLCVLSISGKDG